MEHLVAGLKAMGRDVDMKVIKGQDLEDQGFGGLWNVGKACRSTAMWRTKERWMSRQVRPTPQRW